LKNDLLKPFQEGGRDTEGVNSTMIHCKNFGKCHNAS
jgi:hypothetical protein